MVLEKACYSASTFVSVRAAKVSSSAFREEEMMYAHVAPVFVSGAVRHDGTSQWRWKKRCRV